MKKIRFFSFILMIGMLFSAVAPAAQALDTPAVSAQAVVVLDASTGEILYEKNADERRSPASLTKIMTGLLAVEALDRGEVSMDETVTAGLDCQTGLDQYSSNASIVAGEQMSFRDYFYCAMVVSANEACNVLGSRIAGSIGGFVDRMNQRAEELGCANTHFSDPNGLSNDNHYSSARDMSVMLLEAMRHEAFVEAFTAKEYQVPATNANDARELKNSNALIAKDSIYSQYGNYLYEPALGGKTGYTRQAGYCLASVAEKNGLRLLTVVMGCPGPLAETSAEPENFKDTIALYQWAFDNFAYQQVLSTADILAKIPVKLADDDGTASLHCTVDVTLLLPNDVPPDSRELEIRLYEDRLTAPIAAGTTLGQAVIHINGKSYGPVDLVTVSEVKMARAEFIREQVDIFFARREVRAVIVVLALILVLYFALVLRYRMLRIRHLREKRRAEQRRRAVMEQRRQTTVHEPTLRFTAMPQGEQDADAIDLAQFFDDEKK